MTTPTKPNRRPSMAEIKRRRVAASEAAARASERAVDPSHLELVNSYTSPGISREQLAPIRDFLRIVVAKSDLAGDESVRKHCTHLARLAQYGLTRGRDLVPINC